MSAGLTGRQRAAAATLRLGPMRRQFYDLGEWTPDARDYVCRHGLDLDTMRAHAGHFAIALCKFFGDNDGSRVFQFSPEGIPAAVVEALGSDGHSVIDLVAWPTEAPWQFATAIEEVDILGAWHMRQRGGAPLPVFDTPLAWLKAGCSGCVPISHDWSGFWLDMAGGPFVAQSIDSGRAVRDLLGPRAVRHRILVARQTARAA